MNLYRAFVIFALGLFIAILILGIIGIMSWKDEEEDER